MLVNALVGAVVTVFLTPFLPFAPVLGGLVGGYLQGGDRRDGVTVGALAGAMAVVPLFLFLVLVGNLFLSLFTAAGGQPAVGSLGTAVLVSVFVGGVVYVVLLSVAGGLLGRYLKAETNF